LAIWFFYYGKKCPFCNQPKAVDDSDIEAVIAGLTIRPELIDEITEQKPSKKN